MTRTNAHAAPTRQPAPRDVTTRGRPSALRAWTARHPLTSFLVIVFGLEYPMVALPILATHDLLPGRGLIERLPVPPEVSVRRPASTARPVRCVLGGVEQLADERRGVVGRLVQGRY